MVVVSCVEIGIYDIDRCLKTNTYTNNVSINLIY